MASRQTGSARTSEAGRRAGGHLAARLEAGEVERFGAGLNIEQALARLDGGRATAFNDGIVWDAVALDSPEEARALAKLLVAHGIRCAAHRGSLVFRQADVRSILIDLGYLEAAPAAEGPGAFTAPAVDAASSADGASGKSAQAVSAAPAPVSATARAASAVAGAEASSRDDRLSYYMLDEQDASGTAPDADGSGPAAAAAREEERRRALSADERAVERLSARVSAGPAQASALSPSDRAELLEHLARLADEREVPTLSSPLRVPEGFSHLLGFDAPVPPKSFAERAFRVCMQMLLIYAICLTGEKIASLLAIGVPGNIVSMILLLVFLLSGVIRMESISLAADFLLDHMAVFFVPAAVAIMGNFDIIAPNLLKLLLVCLLTTVLVFFVTSFTVSTVMNLMARGEAARAGKGE